MQRLFEVWADFEQAIVDKALDLWSKRHGACVKTKEQHFEHLLQFVIIRIVWTDEMF